MPTNSRKKKGAANKNKSTKAAAKPRQEAKHWAGWTRVLLQSITHRVGSFRARRPHRTLRLTRRRDAVRPLNLPGNISFTAEVARTLWKSKNTFLLLGLVYTVLYLLLVGIQSQASYSTFSNELSEAGGELFSGNWGALSQASVLLFTIASTNLGGEVTEAQQIIAVFIFLMTWLASVWLLRNTLAGHKVKLRDGLYNAGSPLIAMGIVTLVVVIQLLPVAIAAIGYGAAAATGLLDGGVAAMLFWVAAGLLSVLSLYWITSSLFAMVIVTLPGVYPFAALGAAGDIVLGRRVPILLRWLWLALTVVVAAIVIMIPIILLDMGVKSAWPAIEWVPIVPFAFLVFAAYAIIWCAAYVYVLYRRVVDSGK